MEVISFRFPHVFNPASSQVENARALQILLEALISLNMAYLEHHTVPTLYKSGVVYGRTNEWDTIPALYERGFGDCKSLTAAQVAEYRRAGLQAFPVFRFIPRRSDGGLNFHILTQTATRFEDPSKVLGMGADENARFSPGPRVLTLR